MIVAVSIGVAFGTIGVVGLASGTTTPTPSVYSAVAPVTVLGRSLAANSNTDVTVAGVDSVPSNATSVQLSVTALDGTATSSMYVYPTGATQPTSANVRWTTGETVTIPVTVAVGTAGKVRLTTDGGTVTVKVAVVGYFSPTPAPGPAGYAAEVGSVAIIDEEDGGTTIASLDVPAGTYEVQFKASMSLGSSASDSVICYLEGPASETIDDVTMYLASGTHEGIMSLVGLDTTTGGALTAYCYDTDSSVDAYNVQLVAVQLSSATGAVAGG